MAKDHFLGLSNEAAERDPENALTSLITDTLQTLGPGFSFVGRQVHFDVDAGYGRRAHAHQQAGLVIGDRQLPVAAQLDTRTGQHRAHSFPADAGSTAQHLTSGGSPGP